LFGEDLEFNLYLKDLIYNSIAELRYMKPITCHSGIGKSRSDDPHHGRQKI
jgi:hypothetical protein